MASFKKENHSLLACKICMKSQEKLSVHLRRVCMKTANKDEITKAVEEAKRNRHKLLASLSIVSYQDLNFRNSRFSDPQKFFADFLERHGCIVADKISERQVSIEDAQSEEDVNDGTMTRSPLRKKLCQAGLYTKHDLLSPVLDSFKQYLKKHFSDSCINQMVENVSRYLYFMDPDDISLDFMNDLEKTKRFVSTLLSLKTSHSTVKKYLNHVHHFVNFANTEDFPNDMDEERKPTADHFLAGLIEIKNTMFQKGDKAKKNLFLTPKETRKVLTAAKSNVESIFTRANLGEKLADNEKILACYYLEALLMLKHLCKPSIIQFLTVKEWIEREFSSCFQSKKVSIITTDETMIVLEEEEELLFNTYFTDIRPTQLVKDKKTVDNFFVTSIGLPINNASKDLSRFHEKFNLPPVTNKEAKDAFNKWALSNLSKEKRDIVNVYVNLKNHKPVVRKRNLVEGMYILATLKADHQGESSRKRKRTEDGEEDEEEGEDKDMSSTEGLRDLKESAYDRLLKIYPVDLNKPPPTLATCAEASKHHAQYTQDRWRRMQYKIRVDYVVEKFRNPPSKEQVLMYMKEQGWHTNIPKADIVLKAWKPHESRKKQENWVHIENLVDSQEWKGLVVVNDPKKGGHSVRTTQAFKKGDIVCDYHGVLMGGKEGEELQKRQVDEKCYIFFFQDKGKKMCINATQAPCDCHSQMPSTFGRLMNHSRKRDNVKPMLKYAKGGTVPIILFKAKEDIAPGTELLFDYGIKRKSYGEGADLDWLND